MTKVIEKNNERIKSVIVLANENEYNLEPFIKRCATCHKDTLIEFVYVTGIEFPNTNIYRTSSQELAYYLTEQGFSVLLQTDENNQKELTIYLPETLGKIQRQYLNLVTSMIENCKLSVFQINSKDEVFDYCEDASQNVDLLINLIKDIKEFETDDNKPRKLTIKP